MIKAKLYKGPMHGKTYMVPDEAWEIQAYKPQRLSPIDFENPSPVATMPPKIIYRRTHHTHPDGSTFYVYEG